jgi:hypothetical protein
MGRKEDNDGGELKRKYDEGIEREEEKTLVVVVVMIAAVDETL